MFGTSRSALRSTAGLKREARLLTDETPAVRTGLFANFKRLFRRGLAALLPTLVTIAILIWAYELVNTYIGRYIADGCITFIARVRVPTNADPADFIDDAVAFRLFHCPNCGSHIDNEIAVESDPVMRDIELML